MILTIDVGNTNINFALFKDNKVLKYFISPSNQESYYAFLKKILLVPKIEGCIISSVVPLVTLALEKDLKKLGIPKLIVLGKNHFVGIKNRYKYPKQVGQDRLVNAYAASKFFGAPAIIIDFGTAITFDIVSDKKEYLGGIIIPGFRISLEALAQKTALLPKVTIERPRGLIGKDTKSSMLSGIVFGYSIMTDGLIEQLKKTFKKQPYVIGTGGNINFISKYCQNISFYDKDLTLRGLNLIYNEL